MRRILRLACAESWSMGIIRGFRVCGRDQGFPTLGCRPFLTENEHTGPFSGRAEPLDLR